MSFTRSEFALEAYAHASAGIFCGALISSICASSLAAKSLTGAFLIIFLSSDAPAGVFAGASASQAAFALREFAVRTDVGRVVQNSATGEIWIFKASSLATLAFAAFAA